MQRNCQFCQHEGHEVDMLADSILSLLIHANKYLAEYIIFISFKDKYIFSINISILLSHDYYLGSETKRGTRYTRLKSYSVSQSSYTMPLALQWRCQLDKWGGHIHIFVFRTINWKLTEMIWFQKKLIVQNRNIWICPPHFSSWRRRCCLAVLLQDRSQVKLQGVTCHWQHFCCQKHICMK